MLGAEHAAPGLPDHMVAGSNAELLYQVLQLVQEQPGGPEIGALVAKWVERPQPS
jgi:hypothetical protein